MSGHAYTTGELESIAKRLGGAIGGGPEWGCRCPTHDDRTASLSLSLGEGGKLLWHCHAGCGQAEVLEGLKRAGLLLNGDARPAQPRSEKQRGERVAAYPYTDESGQLLYEKVRYDPKDFKQRRPDGNGGWIWKLGDTRRVLYHFPDVIAADEVVIVEGEKDADRLRALGFTATTNFEGASKDSQKPKWREEYSATLAGKNLVFIPDNDAAGQAHMENAARSCHAAGAASVRIAQLEGLPDKGDVSDWLDAGHTADELRDLIAKAPEWEPPPERWTDKLLTSDGGPRACEANVVTALNYAPELAGRLRLNLLTEAVECSSTPWSRADGDTWRAWTDNDDTALAVWCQHRRIMVKTSTVAAAVQLVASGRPHHPIRDYLGGLRWDGTKRLDTWATTYLGAEDSAYSRAVGRSWLISAVARVYEAGAKVDHTLILEGGQGDNKSSAFEALCHDRFWYTDGIADLGSKDSAQDLRGKWIIELGELSAMSRSEVERIKGFLTRSVDHYRPSYGRRSRDFPRQCVFAGTTNLDEYLRDETGNRRFWPILVNKLDLQALIRDRDQLWAEALVEYRKGARWWLDKDTEKLARTEQELRRVTDVWEETVLPWLASRTDPVSKNDVLDLLGVPAERRTQSDANRVAKILKKEGWKRKRTRVPGERLNLYHPPARISSSPEPEPTSTPPVPTPPTLPNHTGDVFVPTPPPLSPVGKDHTGDKKASNGADVPSVPSVPSRIAYTDNAPDGSSGTSEAPLRTHYSKPVGTPGTLGTTPARRTHSHKVSRQAQPPPEPPKPAAAEGILELGEHQVPYQFIAEPDAAREAVAELIATGQVLGIDFETTGDPERSTNPKKPGLDIVSAVPRLLQLSTEGRIVVVDLLAIGGLGVLSDLLVNLKGCAHNAAFETNLLVKAGIRVELDCTMLAEQLLTGEVEGLAKLSERYLGLTIGKVMQKADWSGMMTDEHVRYAAQDAWLAQKLWGILKEKVAELRSTRIYELTRAAQPVVADMRLAGMPIDREEHARLSDELQTEVERLRPQLEEVLGSNKLGNRKLWAEWLAKALGGVGSPGYAKWPKTKTGSLKTGNDDLLIGLELLPTEAARIVRELLIPYFETSKLDGTYGNGYREHIHPVTGRVHGDFKLSCTITGRMSCSDPNVQNVPRDPRFRALYRASEGRRLVIGDYSMAEMRVAAMYADEKKMLAMFEAGEDVHKLTAASLLNKPVEKVSKEERQLAKAVGFGLLFGQSARGLQRYAANTYGVEMTEDEADSYRTGWLRTYPDLRRWQRKQEDTTKAEMAVRTHCGRVRRWTSRVYEEKGGYRKTEALNTPIQGSAAEALLYSLVCLSGALRDIDALIINATHDEIVIEAGDADVLRAKAVLEESMIAGMLDVFPNASTIGLVEARIGRSWGDK